MIKRIIAGILTLAISTAALADSWLCSGFFISPDGYVATAGHCVTKHSELTILYKGKEYPVKIIGVDHGHDSALLKIDVQPDFYYNLQLTVADGYPIFVLGYPRPEQFGWNLKITAGHIYNPVSASGEDYVVYARSYPGNSGGPVVNIENQVVGILVAGYTIPIIDGSDHSFAEPIQYLVELAKSLDVILPTDNIGVALNRYSIFNQATSTDSVVLIYGEN